MGKRFALGALLVLCPGLALGADLTISGGAEVEYDDNVFRNKDNEKDDVVFRFRPAIKIHEDRGQDLLYSLEYEVPFEFYVDYGDELDDIDHLATGRMTWHVTDRMEIFATDRFRYLRGNLRDVQTIGDEGLQVNEERERVTTNFAETGFNYQISPRLIASARGSHDFFDTDRDDRSDWWQVVGATDLLYALTPKHQVGGGVRATHQDFDSAQTIAGSELTTYTAFAQWLWQVDQTLDLVMRGGPTYLDSSQDSLSSDSTSARIPSTSLGGNPNVTGFIDLNGDAAEGTGKDFSGGRLVSQLGNCPTVAGPGGSQVPFFNGSICSPVTRDGPGNVATGVALTQAEAQGLDIDERVQLDTQFADTDDDTSLDFFGEFEVRKRWTPNFQSALRYRRDQGGAGGLGGAVIRDVVNFSNVWDFAERWQLFARADWSLRQSVQDATRVVKGAGPEALSAGVIASSAVSLLTPKGGDNNEVDTMRWGVAARLTHRFTRNTDIWTQLTYNEQDSNGNTLGAGSDFENFLAVVGVRHVFEPIKLW